MKPDSAQTEAKPHRVYLFPAIDLRGGKVVRLRQGDYSQQTVYGDDPVEQAKRFEQAGARWLHVVDLDGARSGDIAHLDTIQAICKATGLTIEVGGGVRDRISIDSLLEAGVSRVILGTAALRDWDWFASLLGEADYRNRLVLGLDARDGKLAIHGWQQTTTATAIDIARKVTDWPLAAIVYTDIFSDGTMSGPNLDATRRIAGSTRVPIVASGGVGTLDHLRQLRELSIEGAIVGTALYENAFTIEQALAAFELGQ